MTGVARGGAMGGWISHAVQRSTYFPEANLLVPLILLPYLKNKYLNSDVSGQRSCRNTSGNETIKLPRAVRHTEKVPWPR